MKEKAIVTLLGTRGSVPVSGPDFLLYGGDSSCVLVQMGGECILLDAGSGLMRAASLLAPLPRRLSLLLSHPHADHLIGLPSFEPLYQPGWRMDIYAADREAFSGRQQVEALMSPPLWPTGLDAFAAELCFPPLAAQFSIGGVQVRAMEGCHPGGCTVFRLQHGDASVVYCTDFEHRPEAGERLAAFAQGCSLLIYDAHFTEAEAAEKPGWGHSTARQGAEMGRRCGAGRVALYHHHPQRTDAELARMEAALRQKYPNSFFGKCGQEVRL